MKNFFRVLWLVLVAVAGFFAFVFLNVKPKPKKQDNFVVKDEDTVVTSTGQAVDVAPGQKAEDVVSAVTVAPVEVPADKIAVHVREASPTPVPKEEEKSAGELLFGPRGGK